MNFEYLAIKSLLDGKLDLIPELKIDFFTKSNSKIYEKILEFFSEHKRTPTYSELSATITAKAPSSVVPQFMAIIQAIQNIQDELDLPLILVELKDAYTLREVDKEMAELIDAQRNKDTKKVKELLNVLNEKVNLSGIKVKNMSDMKDFEENRSTAISFLDKASEDMVMPGGLTGLSIISAESGGGKAQPVDTIIPTPYGYKRLGDITIGDYVFGKDGKETRVQGVFPQGVRPMYKVTFKDGRSTIADKEHIWTVRLRGAKELRDMTTKEIIDSGISVPRTDPRYGTTNESPRFSIPLCDPAKYPEKLYTIPPYVIGALIGDGTLSNSTQFTTQDTEIIEFFNSDLEGTGCTITKHKSEYQYGITKFMVGLEYLRSIQLNTTSEYKFIPEEYLLGSIKQRQELLQGLLDTDGYVAKGNSRIEYTTVSYRLSKDVAELVHSLGGTCTISYKAKSGYRNKIGEFIQCKPAYRLSIRFHSLSTIKPFRLQRKALKYTCSNKLQYLSIVSIEPVASTEAVCISVEAKDSLYLTNSYIVTHNTILLIQTALNNFKAGKNVFFITLEMSAKVVYNRLISAESGVDFSTINSKIQTPEEQKLIDAAHNTLFNPNNPNKFLICDDEMTDSSLVNLISVEAQLNGIDLFVLDYLQLIEAEGYGDDWRSLTKLCKRLNKLTIIYGVVIASASQVNEEGFEKGSIIPKISTRGSKEIKFSSSQMFHVAKDNETGMLNLFTLKNRIAQPRHIILQPQFKYMRVESTGVELEV